MVTAAEITRALAHKVDHDITTSGLCDSIFDSLGCKDKLTRVFIAQVLRDVALFDRKQCDYGPANIAEFGERGVLVRANDKLARLKHLRRTNAEPQNESVVDSWTDLSVYGVIARMCISGQWPGAAKEQGLGAYSHRRTGGR